MDNKLTDNEIMKAFKRITEYQGFTSSVSKTLKSTLDLITRQQAEIERLKTENSHYAELEQGCYVTGVKNIKAEAYKEFAERLKTEYAKGMSWFKKKESYYVDVGDIDNLVKEMVGDSDDS